MLLRLGQIAKRLNYCEATARTILDRFNVKVVKKNRLTYYDIPADLMLSIRVWCKKYKYKRMEK